MNFLNFPILLSAAGIVLLCCYSASGQFIVVAPNKVPSIGIPEEDRIFKVNEQPEILRKPNALYSDLGVIRGVRQCGGSGKVLQWRDEGCAASQIGGPCYLPAYRFFRSEISFAAGSDSNGIYDVRTTLMDPLVGNRELKSWDSFTVYKHNVETGIEYVLTSSGAATSELRGRLITKQVRISKNDGEMEACAEADFVIV